MGRTTLNTAANRTQSDYSPAKLSREPQETHEITGLFIFSGRRCRQRGGFTTCLQSRAT